MVTHYNQWMNLLSKVDRVRWRVYCRFEDNLTHWCRVSNVQRLGSVVILLSVILFHYLAAELLASEG